MLNTGLITNIWLSAVCIPLLSFYLISLKKLNKILCNQNVSYIFVQPKGFIKMRRDTFQAIADPTRREILSMIAYKSLNVNSVTEHFDVSRTAIYKHIKILTECGLIVMKQEGRERYCEAHMEKLNEVSEWVDQYRKFWTERLDNLEIYLAELQSKNKKDGTKK
jgi:DNA-binding transcriptional ArsR family regulator